MYIKFFVYCLSSPILKGYNLISAQLNNFIGGCKILMNGRWLICLMMNGDNYRLFLLWWLYIVNDGWRQLQVMSLVVATVNDGW